MRKKKKKSIYQDIFLLVGKYQRTNFATKSYLHFMKNQWRANRSSKSPAVLQKCSSREKNHQGAHSNSSAFTAKDFLSLAFDPIISNDFLLLLLFQIKIYNFWKGWTFGYKFLTASSQTSIEIAKKKKINNKALWKGGPVTCQDLRGTSVDRMPAIPVKRRPTRTLLPKKADSGQVLSLNSSYINYFRRSKAED